MKYQFLAKNCQKGLAAAILLLEIVRRLASGEVSKATFEVVVVASSVIGRFQPVTPLKFMLIERQLYAQEQPVM
jgi:hypothetical protein